jgi:uncharacterized membrane protein
MAKLTLSVEENAKETQNVMTTDGVVVTETPETSAKAASTVTEASTTDSETAPAEVKGVTEVATETPAVNDSTAAFKGDELKPFMWHVTHLDNGQVKFRNTTTGRVFVGSTAEFTAKLRG